ncbi:MAG: exosortase system-associated protein, TIGR04073 family [Chthoniobacterales bacterium]|nr:MAG: exosortase system-associated protein, TIGR04073 family [Chthoniobacterales bacterium]
MKNLLAAAVVLGFASYAFADIQDPPSNDYGPTRKLGRGISNVVFGIAELPVTIARVNEREGNSAAGGYGVVRGLGRSYMRFHAGLFEIFSFPFPVNRGTYYPILPPHIPYIHAGYEEFPPELGNESKYPYVRMY